MEFFPVDQHAYHQYVLVNHLLIEINVFDPLALQYLNQRVNLQNSDHLYRRHLVK